MRKNVPLILIFTVVFVDLLGFGLLIPILPTYAAKVLHVSESYVGILIAIYSLVQFIFNPIFGSLSDKHGRRNIILYTLLLNATGYLIFAFTRTYSMLIVSRIICGLGGSSIGVAQAYIADVTTKDDRSKGMALIGVAFGLGFIFGPILGGILSHFGYMVVGLTSGAFSFTAFMLSVFFLPESRDKKTLSNIPRRKMFFDIKNFIKIIKTPSLGIVIILFFVITFSVANIFGTFPLLGYHIYHFSDLQIGLMFGVIGVVSVVIQGGLIGKLTKKFNDNQLITIGAFCMMFGLGFLPFGRNIFDVVVICVVYACGIAVLQPILLSLVSKIAPENEQGIVLGTNQSLSSLARMLGPLWGGFSFEFFGYQTPFLTGAIFTFLIFIFSVFYFKHHVVHESVSKF